MPYTLLTKYVTVLFLLAAIAISPAHASMGEQMPDILGKIYVSSVKGKVLKSKPGQPPKELQAGDSIEQELKLETLPQSKAELHFADGTVLRLYSNSLLVLNRFYLGSAPPLNPKKNS